MPSTIKEIGDEAFFSLHNSIILKIQKKEGEVTFGSSVVYSNDKVEYVGEGWFSKLFGR